MIIVIQCKDQVGLVGSIATILAQHQLNIVSMREHVDKAENIFFVRLEVEDGDTNGLEDTLKRVLPAGAIISVNPAPHKKIVVMVTKEYHCLAG